MPEQEIKPRKSRRETIILAPTRIYAKDFGPIREADIKLGKITILMGPNNTGKTFTVALLPVLNELLLMLMVVPFLKIRKVEIGKFLRDNFPGYITNIYSVDELWRLVRQGSDRAVVSYQLETIGTLTQDTYELKFLIDRSGDISVDLNGLEELINEKKILRLPPLIFVPAERAGIMRTYKQLLRLHLETSLFRVPPSLRKRVVELLGSKVQIPGLVRILLDEILSIKKFTLEERMKSAAAQALEVLEEEVLRGRLEMGEDLSVTYHEIEAEKPIDLINASSMVSEISAIYFLSAALKSGGWLIVEEPEAHVHPRGQMGLARFMARLARGGVNVVATTHSDLIALKLAQMVGLAKLRPEERRSLGYKEDEYLKKDDLALYYMEQTENGSVARRIEVSDTGEVAELPTYTKVIEEMYGEAVKLLELHGKIPRLSEAE